MSSMTFERRWVVIPGLILIGFFLYQIFKKPQTLGRGLASIMDRVLPMRRRLYWIRQSMVLLIILSAVVLLMKPVYVSETTETSKEGIDIVLTLDVSGSMGADDFKPDRLSVARETLEQFVDELESDRVGLVVFAGKPFTSVPLTFDYDITKQIISQTTIETINQNVRGLNGTAIGDAMLAGLGILEKGNSKNEQGQKPSAESHKGEYKKGDREQVMILVTDGTATQGTFNPMGAAAFAIEQGVTVYTVGIGSIEGGSVPFQTPFGIRRQAVGGVDEKVLRAIADATGGKYWRAKDAQTFQGIFDELSTLTKSEVKTETIQTSTPALVWLEWLMMICVVALLILHIGVRYRMSRSTRYQHVQPIVLIISTVLGGIVLVMMPPGEEVEIAREVSVVLDVSKSMQVQDVGYLDQSVSRLQVAKTIVQRAVDAIGDAKWGMQVFAGASTTVLPVTSDRELFLTFLKGVNRESVLEGGSDLGQAIREASDRFIDTGEEIQRTLLVVSDGGEEEVTIDEQTQETLIENNVELLVIGVGTTEGGPIIEGIDRYGNPVMTQYQGETVIAGLGEDILQSVARQGGGEYVQVDDVESITDAVGVLAGEEELLGVGWVGGGWYDIVLIVLVLMMMSLSIRRIYGSQES